MHAVGQPPMVGNNDSHFHYLTEAGVQYSRLHDVGGRYGAGVYVDIPNIFRNFDADVNDPASYDFAFTDWLLEALAKADVEPIYRLGVTIENYPNIKAYHIYPPTDYDKWAKICEHIIMHYNEGWANGYNFDIKYWEIWNEPDGMTDVGSMMWLGTQQEFFDLYKIAACHLKNRFGDKIKIGGYASCGYGWILKDPEHDRCMKYFIEFLEFARENNLPLDFFSWHSYDDVITTGAMADFVAEKLKEYGYGDTESHLNEWNNAFGPYLRGTAYAAAQAAAMMLHQQNKATELLCYYDARIGASPYCGMFDGNNWEPTILYYAFKAFNELYKLGTQVECDWETEGIYAVAAKGAEGKAIMLTNVSENTVSVECEEASGMTVYLIDDNHKLQSVDCNASLFDLEKNQTVLIK